ncbi:MAG: DUF4440 domain-containing protein [Xanthomonadales bacterium]|nr:DUF4440 domain-containing protein [Xanthomonadales bacterium]NIN60260.1 DUF4440 domain-containing protein [Xanthomonadales bacterium]NIN74983.1 DUF4440 domain-containing protein [Xanthomonadales bacterium]NIO13602.1 DUF4440 domain-containing protein [Xanthomonadales bacterium]NIP12653.1 DUF4440 domain-containing protein [Xanthomonadales bacterium]
MKKFIWLTLFAMLAGCAEAPPPATTDLEGLKAMREAWNAGFDAGDAAAVAAVYAENGALMPPNAGMVQGREAIEAFWDDFLAMGGGAVITDIDANAGGDVGYKVGTYALTSADGEPLDEGKYIEVWHHADGRWQMVYDIWNSDRPAPAPAEAEVEVEIEFDAGEVPEPEEP